VGGPVGGPWEVPGRSLGGLELTERFRWWEVLWEV
jgi:hypothetical protein